MDNKLSIATLLILISSMGYVGVTDQEPTHYCLDKEIKANCYDLSSTNKTCYTLPGKQGGKRCSNTLWQEIPFYISEIEIPSASKGSYLCHSKPIYSCEEI